MFDLVENHPGQAGTSILNARRTQHAAPQARFASQYATALAYMESIASQGAALCTRAYISRICGEAFQRRRAARAGLIAAADSRLFPGIADARGHAAHERGNFRGRFRGPASA